MLRLHLSQRYWKSWRERFRKRRLIRRTIEGAIKAREKFESEKYARQFVSLQTYLREAQSIGRSFRTWREKTQHAKRTEARRIQLLAADNFLRSRLLSKYYFRLKELVDISKGARRLSAFLLERGMRPRFGLWRSQSQGWQEIVTECNTTRTQVHLYKCFSGWKDVTLKNRLVKLMYTRCLFREWWQTASRCRIAVPYKHWETQIARRCWSRLQLVAKSGWNKRRGAIIGNQLGKKRLMRLGKLGLAGLLEHVLARKKYVCSTLAGRKTIIDQSVREFRTIGLQRRAFTAVSEYAAEKKRAAANERKALEFDSSRRNRVDPNMVRGMMRNWLMYSSTKAGEKTIVRRFREFRGRLRVTKCFLTWVETARTAMMDRGPVRLEAELPAVKRVLSK